MAKPQKNQNRRAVVEQMRREQQRAERKRNAIWIGAAAAVGLLIIGLGAYPVLKGWLTQSALGDEDLAGLGASATAAGCQDVVAEKATGSADHRPEGTPLRYADSPPATGPHFPAAAPLVRKFYSPEDRPPLGYLVHNLEHGYSVLWYDETIAKDEDELAVVEAIASKFPEEEYEGKFIAAPWTSEDGKPFPDGAHVALTHWSMGGTNGNPEGQTGVTQYCTKPSGEAVTKFVEDYPYTDSPEPGAA